MKLVLSCFLSLFLWVSYSVVFSQSSLIDRAKDFRIEKLQGKELIVSFTTSLDMLPQKTAAVKIKKGKLFKNEEYYGSFELTDKIKLNKKSDKDLKVRIKVNLEKEINIMEEGLKALMGNPLQLRMTGKFKATRIIFWKNYPFDLQENVSLKNFIN